MGTATNVIKGSGSLYLALTSDAGAVTFLNSIPGLTVAPVEADWTGAGFVGAGYTDSGVNFSHAGTWKDITVDEEFDPVDQLLTAQKTEVQVKLAEGTIENLAKAIAGSTLTGTTTKVLRFGSPTQGQILEFLIGFQGPNPAGDADRVLGFFRAKNTASASHNYQRTDKVILDVIFSCLADSTQAAGEKTGFCVDFGF